MQQSHACKSSGGAPAKRPLSSSSRGDNMLRDILMSGSRGRAWVCHQLGYVISEAQQKKKDPKKAQL